MTEKRYKVISDNFGEYSVLRHDNSIVIPEIPRKTMAELFCDELNELNDEKEWLEMNNKDLVSFIKSKRYTLKDFLKYVGQFSSVGVNKEDWND